MSEKIKKISAGGLSISLMLFTAFIFILSFIRSFTGGTALKFPFMPDSVPGFVSFILMFLAAILCAYIIGRAFKLTKRITDKNTYLNICILCILRIATSLIFILVNDNIPKSDFRTFYLIADNLANGNAFSPDYVAFFPNVFGYPAFLSVAFRIFGSSVLVGQLFNLLCSCIATVLIYLIGKRIFDVRCGFFSAVIWLLMPSQILYSMLLTSEPLYNALLLAAVYVFVLTMNRREAKLSLRNIVIFAVLGILTAILAAIRPNGLILLVTISIILIVFIKPDGGAVKKLQIISKAALFIILIGAYAISSVMITKAIEKKIDMKTVSTSYGWNLYVGFNRDSVGFYNSDDGDYCAELRADIGGEAAQQKLADLAIERIRSALKDNSIYKFITVKAHNMWQHDHEVIEYLYFSEESNKTTPLSTRNFTDIWTAVCDIYYYAVLILFLMALIRRFASYNEKDIMIYVFMLIIIGTILLHIPLEASTRYHITAVMAMCFIAAGGFSQKRNRHTEGNIDAEI